MGQSREAHYTARPLHSSEGLLGMDTGHGVLVITATVCRAALTGRAVRG
jgi:hypothetical protein